MNARRFVALVLAAAMLLAGYGVWLTTASDLVPQRHADRSTPDIELYDVIVSRMRAGESYYPVARDELVSRGYPTAAVFNWRVPTLAALSAALPRGGARALLGVLSLAGLALWAAHLRRYGRGSAAAGSVLLLGLFAWPAFPGPHLVHEAWAGVLIALSLACVANGWATWAVAAGLAALAIREHAAVYVLVSLAFALRAGRRGEAAAWAAGFAAFLAGFALHAAAVAGQGIGSEMDAGLWLEAPGWPFVLRTAHVNVWLISLHPAVTAALVPLALVGFVGWREAVGRRVAATVGAYVLAYLFVGRTFNYYWGLLYSGLLPMGLLFLPRAIWSSRSPQLDRAGVPLRPPERAGDRIAVRAGDGETSDAGRARAPAEDGHGGRSP